jgi:hypothetical protein
LIQRTAQKRAGAELNRQAEERSGTGFKMAMKRKCLLGSAFAAIVSTIALLMLVPGSRPKIDCWDCSWSFEQALATLGVILTSLTIGTWLRGCSRLLFRGLGNIFLCITGLYIWVIHHAGRNWGINHFGNPHDCYDPSAVSVFVILLIIVCIGFAVYFDRQSLSKQK